MDGWEISDGVSNGDIAGSVKFWRGMPLTVVLRARVTRAPCQWYNAEWNRYAYTVGGGERGVIRGLVGFAMECGGSWKKFRIKDY